MRGQLKSGRPTTREATNKKISKALKISEEEKIKIIEKLEEAAQWDCTQEEMCFHAGISHDTYNRWVKEKPELGVRIEALRNTPVLIARKTATSKITESYQNAMDYLKRKRKQEFSERSELTGADGNELKIEISKEIADKNEITPLTGNNSKG